MIAKCKAISHGRALLEYAMREGKMERIVLRNMVSGTTSAEVLSELELVNGYNSRCRNKYLRFEIGIAPQDVAKLKPGDLNKIVKSFADKMGLQNHQYIAVTHKDTDNLHIHLIANRIGVDSKVYDTDFVSNRSAKAAEEISREMGLTIAKEVRAKKEYVVRGQDSSRLAVRAELQKLAYECLRNSKNPREFTKEMQRKGIWIQPMKNKQGKVYGLRFIYKGEEFKASEIGREFGLYSLFNHYGLRLDTQKGNPFVPQYISNSLSPIIEVGKATLSVGGNFASSVTEGVASIAGAISDGNSALSDYDPDAADTARIESEERKRRKKKIKRSKGPSL